MKYRRHERRTLLGELMLLRNIVENLLGCAE